MPKGIVTLGMVVLLSLFTACQEEVLPKPTALLRLDYPVATYMEFNSPCPFEFQYNADTKVKVKQDCGVTIAYPKMKATVYLTYRQVNNNIDDLLKDAQKLTFENVIKADDIVEIPFMNPENKVYGMFYDLGGNAASNTQFYLTDSIQHFVTGSVYFYSKPNYDSIMPASSYIKDDMKTLMETIRWKAKN